METMEINIEQEDSGNRIDRMLGRQLFPDYSRSYLTCMIEAGSVLVDGKKVKKNYRLEVGETVTLTFPPRVRENPEAEDLAFSVLFEDEHLIIVDKPEGMVIHPGTGTRGRTLVNGLLHRYPEIARVGIAFRPGIVHRLDRETSGVLVVARSNLSRYHLVEQFKNRVVEKEYHALLVGKVPFDSDYIDMPLGRDLRNQEKMRVDRRKGKPASTYYEVMERFKGYTFMRVLPHTGRTHQIRVHMGHIGYPVIADALYMKNRGQLYRKQVEKFKAAGRPVPSICRHALHARRISFDHPISGERVAFESPLPPDMEQLLDWLRTEHRIDEIEA